MAYKISGITRDNTGNLTGSVDVFLLKYNSGTHTFTQIQHLVSDSGNGAFIFSGIADNDSSYSIVAFKDGTPHTFDISDRNLTPVQLGYSGVADAVASTITYYYGLRSIDSANVGVANCVKLRETGGSTESYFTSDGSGLVDVAAITTFKGANNLFTVNVPNQAGSGWVNQENTSAQPSFGLTSGPGGSFPAIVFNGSTDSLADGGRTLVQPYSITLVFYRTSGSDNKVILNYASDTMLVQSTTANNISFYAGTDSGNVAAADNTFHSLQIVFNGTSSKYSLNGAAPTTVNLGTSAPSGINFVIGQYSAGGFVQAMRFLEYGAWSNHAFTDQEMADLHAQQAAFWGI